MTTKQLANRVMFIIRRFGYPPGRKFRVQIHNDTPAHWKRAVLFDVEVDLDEEGIHAVVEIFRLSMCEYDLGAKKFRRIVHKRLCRALGRAVKRLLPKAAGYKQAKKHLENLNKIKI